MVETQRAIEYIVVAALFSLLYLRSDDASLSQTRRDLDSDLQTKVARLEQRLITLEAAPLRGLDGLDGEQGPRGHRGERGMLGKDGRTGSRGPAGRDGRDGYCAVINGTTGEVQVPCPEQFNAANAQEVERLKGIVASLSRVLVITQIAQEQRVRSEGGSGLTQVRNYGGGSQAYYEPAYTNVAFANAHNHANNLYTVGLGEMAAVLNGVEFWTRHNDYALRSPSTTSEDYGATDNVEMPQVPPAVTAYTSIDDQAEEMRRWFHAWQDQDPSCPSCKKLDDEREAMNLTRWDAPDTVREYAPYFPPILCYMEGTWLKATDADIEEPFHSDRHFIDAKDWRELYDKNRYLLQSGRKSSAENLPFLPYSVREVDLNSSDPEFANWEYRIACHRLKDNVPLDRFQVAPDLAVQLQGGRAGQALTMEELERSRYARFELNPINRSTWYEGKRPYQYIDQLMEEVPGKNNYMASIYDDSFATNATHYVEQSRTLNTGYYSRFYGIDVKDAMGRTGLRRGFNDPSLWAAQTTQERVAGVKACIRELSSGEEVTQARACDVTNMKEQKWSYAIPLEIIYLTPLARWNPYNIQHHSNRNKPSENMRDGGLTPDKAFNGSSDIVYYRTPTEFFDGLATEVDEADTSGGVTGVLDAEGNVQQVRASGHWILFPKIKGFAQEIRQRYPIAPVHDQGSTSWKEIKALQALTVGLSSDLSTAQLNGLDAVKEERAGVTLRLAYTANANTGGHSHSFHLAGPELDKLRSEGSVTVLTSQDAGHTHQIQVSRQPWVDAEGRKSYLYSLQQCGSTTMFKDQSCGDVQHTTFETTMTNRTATLAAMNPYALYTQPEQNFDPETKVWRDVSGANRHSDQVRGDGPDVFNQAPATAALRFNSQAGLKLANGTIPTAFTILARARYVSTTGDARRYLFNGYDSDSFGDFSLGWGYGVGQASLGRRVANNGGDAVDRFHVAALRNTGTSAGPWAFLNGQANSYRSPSDLTPDGTAIGINWRGSSGSGAFSDAEVTDVVVFDRHLSDAEVQQASAVLGAVPSQPRVCCWDGHEAVQVVSEF
eukprot:m.155464 g.155464  ORF g.155464 m.155464 type:complete len:1059 (-) comp16417_c0_seq1:98-3274(-)